MLDAAVTIFSQRGYHPASVDEIADAAGVSKPMVYAYLGAKEDLFIACLHREGTRLLEAVAAAVEAGLDPPEQLRRGLTGFLRFVAAHREGWSVLYRHARAQEPSASVLAQLRARFVEMVTALLADAACAAGHPMPEAALTATSHALVGAAEAVADWLADHPDESPEETADRLVTVLWVGAQATLRGVDWRGR